MLSFDLKFLHIKILSVTVIALAVTACNSSGGPMAFAKPSLEANIYQTDVSSCTAYVNGIKAPDSEKTGAVVLSLLLGGFVGAAAAGSAYEETEQRVFEECMYGKGYQMLVVPDGYHPIEPKDEFDKVLPQEVSFELIKEKKLTELLVWNEAISVENEEAIKGYIMQYPQGFYIEEARTRLNAAKQAPAKAKSQ